MSKYEKVEAAVIVIALLIVIVGFVACSMIDGDKARDLNDRAVVLFAKHVAFLETVELTNEQKAELTQAIAEARRIYTEVLEFYGEVSDQATIWKHILSILVALK